MKQEFILWQINMHKNKTKTITKENNFLIV